MERADQSPGALNALKNKTIGPGRGRVRCAQNEGEFYMTTVFSNRLTLSALAAASSLIAISSPVRAQSVCSVTGTTFLCTNGAATGTVDATTTIASVAQGLVITDPDTLALTGSGTINTTAALPALTVTSLGNLGLAAGSSGPLVISATGTGSGATLVSTTGTVNAALGALTTVDAYGASVTGATGASLTTGAITASNVTAGTLPIPGFSPTGGGASVVAATGDATLVTTGNVNVNGSTNVLVGDIAYATTGTARTTVNGVVNVTGTNSPIGAIAIGNTGAFATVSGPTVITGPNGIGLAAVNTGLAGTATVSCGAVTATGTGTTGVIATGPDVVINCGNVLVNGNASLGVGAISANTINASLGTVTVNGTDSAAVVLTAPGAITLGTGNIATTGTAGSTGIAALRVIGGTGPVSLTTGTVSTTGPNSPAILATTTTGALRLTTGNVTTTGTNSAGVVATSDTGALTVSTGNVATAGTTSAGIVATSAGAMGVTTGTVTTTGAGSAGIIANGTLGNVTVNSGRIAATGAGVLARTTTGNQLITLAGAQTTGNSVDAEALGTGSVTVNATAPVTSTAGIGIRAAGTTGTLVVNSVGASGALGGISAIDTGIGTVTVNANGGAFTATAGDALHLESLGTANVVVASGANVQGQGAFDAIDTRGALANNVTVNGIVGTGPTAAGYAVNATGGVTTLAIGATGNVTGALNLTAAADTVNNAGTLNLTGASNFGAGADTLNNSGSLVLNPGVSVTGLEVLGNTGTITASGTSTLTGTTVNNSGQLMATGGTTTLAGLTAFNNSGRIVLADGATNDTLTLGGNYAGSGNSTLTLDADGSLTAADRLVVGGNITGSTVIDINLVGPTPAYNAAGVLLVDGGGTVSANAFTLNPADVQSGFLNLGLRQVGNDTFLSSTLDSSVTDLALVGSFGRDIWYQSFDAYHDTIMGRHAGALTTGNAFGVWGQLYESKDRYGESGRTATIGGTSVSYSDQLRTHRRGAQVGIEYRGNGFVIGGTGGYTWARSEEQPAAAFLKAEGHNYGAYALFGKETGVYGGVLVKRDDFHVDFANQVRGVGFRSNAHSTGVDGELGVKTGTSGIVFDLNAGLSYVKTDMDPWNQYGLTFDWQNNNKSARGRIGARAIFPSAMGAFVGAKVFHEFKDNGYLAIGSSAAGNVANIDYANRGTWVRVEGGLGALGHTGVVLTAWGDLGRTKSFGGRLGFAF